MKYLLPALLLIATAAADVSHLNNIYLPPVGDHSHQHAEYAEQSNEVPQIIGADSYTPEHLLEPSNSLVPEASQPEAQQYEAYPQLQDEDIRIDQGSAPVEAVEAVEATQQQVAYQQPEVEQPEEAVEATQPEAVSFNFDAPVEQQPAAQEFVPQTFGSDIIYSKVPEQGPYGVADQQYDSAASSSIDTQYGSNGGYVY